MNSLHWDSEEEEYSCVTTVSVGASDGYCQTWTSFEESPDEWEEGRCNCTEVSQSGNYCGKWHCEQDEYDKCAKGEGCNDCDPDGTSNISKLNNQESRIHIKKNTGCQYCYNCYGYDSDGYYYSYNIYPQKEYQDCLCMEDYGGHYCQKWYCYEYVLRHDAIHRHERILIERFHFFKTTTQTDT